MTSRLKRVERNTIPFIEYNKNIEYNKVKGMDKVKCEVCSHRKNDIHQGNKESEESD